MSTSDARFDPVVRGHAALSDHARGAERQVAGTVLLVQSRTLATRHGDVTLHVCRDLTRRTYLLVITCGDVTTPEPLLARVHSSCITSETFGGCDCDCAEQLDAALARIVAAGRGVVCYLDQEGRGAGFVAKVRDRMLVQASGGRIGTFEAYAHMGLPSDCRSYDAVAAARRMLGIVAPFVLLTNNPEKLATLSVLGVPVVASASLELAPSPFNRHYLAAKAAAGHRLTLAPGASEAALPTPIEVTTPSALHDLSSLVHVGSYWLPVAVRGRDAAPCWLRLHAYVDAQYGRERVVLEYGDAAAESVLVRMQREALLERLPARAPGVEQSRWRAALRAFVAHGAGLAIVVADRGGDSVFGDGGGGRDGDAAASAVLACRHLAGRVAVPLVHDAPASSPCEWSAALAVAGASTTAARSLAVA